jgi:glycosyltransferase involved in cell wall biosynthesis
MRILLVATNTTRPELPAEVAAGRHQRVDYFELADRFAARYYDYNPLRPNRLLEWVEAFSRCDLRQAVQVAQIARSGKYDLVISLSERVGIPLALLLERTIRHFVIFHHGMSAQKLRLIKLLRLHTRWDLLAAISQAEAAGMRAYLGLSPEHVVALHTPVDTQFYQPQAVEAAGPAFIQSLGLSYRDYPTLIRAMRRLPHIPCQLRVGSSWVERRGGHEAEILPPNVTLQPFVHPHALRTCYAESRFIVVPIRATTQWSAGCTSVQAAQAMGKPVIATRLPGLSEYLIEGETGLLVDQGDERALAETIAELWSNPERIERMGRNAREWMHAHHGLDQWLDRMAMLVQAATTPHYTSALHNAF